MKEITITLPMPLLEVSQNGYKTNSKLSAMIKSRKVAKHRQAAKNRIVILICNGQITRHDKITGYSLAFFYKTMNFRDEGNAEGSCKAYIDGIADGLKINDKHLRKSKLTTQAKDPAKEPRVEITLYFVPCN